MMIAALANTRVGDVPQRRPGMVISGTSLGETVEAMVAAGRGASLVTTEEGLLIGIFTQRDLITKCDHSSMAWRDVLVDDVMSRAMITVTDDTSLADALTRMRRNTIRSLPILRDGRPVGVLSVRDVLAHIAESFPEDFINLPPEPRRSGSGLYGG